MQLESGTSNSSSTQRKASQLDDLSDRNRLQNPSKVLKNELGETTNKPPLRPPTGANLPARVSSSVSSTGARSSQLHDNVVLTGNNKVAAHKTLSHPTNNQPQTVAPDNSSSHETSQMSRGPNNNLLKTSSNSPKQNKPTRAPLSALQNHSLSLVGNESRSDLLVRRASEIDGQIRRGRQMLTTQLSNERRTSQIDFKDKLRPQRSLNAEMNEARTTSEMNLEPDGRGQMKRQEQTGDCSVAPQASGAPFPVGQNDRLLSTRLALDSLGGQLTNARSEEIVQQDCRTLAPISSEQMHARRLSDQSNLLRRSSILGGPNFSTAIGARNRSHSNIDSVANYYTMRQNLNASDNCRPWPRAAAGLQQEVHATQASQLKQQLAYHYQYNNNNRQQAHQQHQQQQQHAVSDENLHWNERHGHNQQLILPTAANQRRLSDLWDERQRSLLIGRQSDVPFGVLSNSQQLQHIITPYSQKRQSSEEFAQSAGSSDDEEAICQDEPYDVLRMDDQQSQAQSQPITIPSVSVSEFTHRRASLAQAGPYQRQQQAANLSESQDLNHLNDQVDPMQINVAIENVIQQQQLLEQQQQQQNFSQRLFPYLLPIRRGSGGRVLPRIPGCNDQSRSLLEFPAAGSNQSILMGNDPTNHASSTLDLPSCSPTVRRASAPEGQNIKIVVDDIDSCSGFPHNNRRQYGQAMFGLASHQQQQHPGQQQHFGHPIEPNQWHSALDGGGGGGGYQPHEGRRSSAQVGLGGQSMGGYNLVQKNHTDAMRSRLKGGYNDEPRQGHCVPMGKAVIGRGMIAACEFYERHILYRDDSLASDYSGGPSAMDNLNEATDSCREATNQVGREFGLHVMGGKMDKEDGKLHAFITWILPGGPAHKVGLRPGDQIIEWDGKCLINMSYEQVAEIIESSANIAELLVKPQKDVIEPGANYVRSGRRFSQQTERDLRQMHEQRQQQLNLMMNAPMNQQLADNQQLANSSQPDNKNEDAFYPTRVGTGRKLPQIPVAQERSHAESNYMGGQLNPQAPFNPMRHASTGQLEHTGLLTYNLSAISSGAAHLNTGSSMSQMTDSRNLLSAASNYLDNQTRSASELHHPTAESRVGPVDTHVNSHTDVRFTERRRPSHDATGSIYLQEQSLRPNEAGTNHRWNGYSDKDPSRISSRHEICGLIGLQVYVDERLASLEVSVLSAHNIDRDPRLEYYVKLRILPER